jgi:transcriptional regulator with XRE-family HTH domain
MTSMDQKSASSAKRMGPQAVIADRVGKIREARGMSRDKLAATLQDLGIDWTRLTVNRLEIGRRENITVTELLALCIALQVAPVDLLVPGHWTDQSYQVTPRASAVAENVREWIRGDELLYAGVRHPESPFVSPIHKDRMAFAQWMPVGRSKQVLRRWLDQDEKDQWIAEQEEARHQRRLDEEEESGQS